MLYKITNYCKILFMCAAFTSCSNKDKENEKLFKEVNTSLTISSNIINRESEGYLKKIKNDCQKAETKDEATIWYVKAEQTQEFSNDLIEYINTLQEKIRSNDNKHLDNEDLKTLFKKLVEYKQKVLAIDKMITEELKHTISLTNNEKDVDEITEAMFVKGFTKLNTQIKLSIYINKAETIKQQIIEFCSRRYTNHSYGYDYDFYTPLITQNATHFKPDETLEINAGFGSFIRSGNTMSVKIDNEDIRLKESAVATYKTKVPNATGKYHKTVRLEYFDQNTGKQAIKEVDVYYTVDE